MHETLNVELGERSYPIYIGRDLLSDKGVWSQGITSSQVVVVTNDVVAPIYLDQLQRSLEDVEVRSHILADGEDKKTLQSFEQLMAFMLENGVDRSATIVALGGGVVGDLAGFAAACYQRGIQYVQVPTTLLAQVDSSVGGKTAVNHALGKNMIGAFYQPSMVVIDTAVLETLPKREFAAGLAEIIKYGLIRDRQFLEWLEQNIAALVARDHAALTHAIRRSCSNKAEVVAEDEREAGNRALLNLGHTFGHAIENLAGYGQWLHGEAVAMGMVMAARMSARLGWLSTADVERVSHLLDAAGLPTRRPENIAAADFLRVMARDKKNLGGRIRLVLLRKLGEAVVTSEYPSEDLDWTLAPES